MPEDTSWDHGLSVAADAGGLAGHAGAVLLRKLADQAGLTAALGPALARAGRSPFLDRGVALVSVAIAIALGARSMNDISVLEHLALVLGAPPPIPRSGGPWNWRMRKPWAGSRRPGPGSARMCGR